MDTVLRKGEKGLWDWDVEGMGKKREKRGKEIKVRKK
jgi:hypothetical protein